jgi:hypothetical protein
MDYPDGFVLAIGEAPHGLPCRGAQGGQDMDRARCAFLLRMRRGRRAGFKTLFQL